MARDKIPGTSRVPFLSLSTGNKKDIPFVQGKYNMGSSGVLGYCGLKWFKVIVSRRYDGKGPWGFTLVRKRPGGGMPVAEYFVLPDGKIPSFEEDALYPFMRGDGKRYDGVHLATGTIIKLYDYQIGSRFSSGFRGSREALNENLVETILPFRILDFRQTPDLKRGGDRALGIDARPFYGMEFLLLNSQSEDGGQDDDEDDEAAATGAIAVATIVDNELGTIRISAIKLKRALPGWLKNSNNRVFHSVNGQVQFKQTRGYLSQSCGLPALKDRVIIIVGASDLTFEAHNEIWKGDREHMRDTIVGERYKEVVTAAIKESKNLQELQQEVAREELQQAAKSERNELFQKLVDADKNLAALLSNREPEIVVPLRGDNGKGADAGSDAFEGKYSPTFLRFEEKARETGFLLPINRTRPVAALSDAENNYLQRSDNTGQLLIDEAFKRRFGVRAHLHNGRLTLYLEPVPGELKIGEEILFRVGLKDPAMPQSVEDEIRIRIVDAKEEPDEDSDKKKAKPKAPEPGGGEGIGQPAPTHGLPRYALLTRDGRQIGDQNTQPWLEGFTELDGGLIEDLGDEGVIYKINYDNVYHLRYRNAARGGDVGRDVMTEKYILGMRILMLGCEYALRAAREAKGSGGDGMTEYLDQFRRMVARGAASTVLALAENLPKIVDKAAVSASHDVE